MDQTSSSSSPQTQSKYSVFQSRLRKNLNDFVLRTSRTKGPLDLKEQFNLITSDLPNLNSNKSNKKSGNNKRLENLKKSIVSNVFSTTLTELTTTSTKALNEVEEEQLTVNNLLDLSLEFIEKELGLPELTLSLIEEFLETATVDRAESMFSYLESRVERLTKDMLPDRGKGLIFLRMQNNLLRRLSKSLNTVFCGRILCFLSSVFPISEKSGVNLRGTFNVGNLTQFESLSTNTNSIDQKELVLEPSSLLDDPIVGNGGVEKKANVKDGNETNESSKEAEEARTKALKAAADKRDFYNKFWSLQTLLSNPPELFKSWAPDPSSTASTPASTAVTKPLASTTNNSGSINTESQSNSQQQPSTPNLQRLKEGISKTLEVFGRMTKKEIELGSNSNSNSSTNNSSSSNQKHSSNQDFGFESYFFPKFLTKSNLLDLEIADPYFRRQVLTQFLIILQFIRSFSLEEKQKRLNLIKKNSSNSGNRVFNFNNEINYVYQSRDESWVLKLSGEVWKTLYATPPKGEVFAMTIQQILIRESNWIMWKVNSCPSFEKDSLSVEEDDKKVQSGFKRLTSEPMKFPFRVGTFALTELWKDKVSLDKPDQIDASNGVPDIWEFYGRVQEIDQKIETVKAENNILNEEDLKKDEAVLEKVRNLEERKTGLTWRAMRIAQSTHLQLFGKIGIPADLSKLIKLIEEQKLRSSSIRPSSSNNNNNSSTNHNTNTNANASNGNSNINVLTDSPSNLSNNLQSVSIPEAESVGSESDLANSSHKLDTVNNNSNSTPQSHSKNDRNTVGETIGTNSLAEGAESVDQSQADIVMLDGESIVEQNPSLVSHSSPPGIGNAEIDGMSIGECPTGNFSNAGGTTQGNENLGDDLQSDSLVGSSSSQLQAQNVQGSAFEQISDSNDQSSVGPIPTSTEPINEDKPTAVESHNKAQPKPESSSGEGGKLSNQQSNSNNEILLTPQNESSSRRQQNVSKPSNPKDNNNASNSPIVTKPGSNNSQQRLTDVEEVIRRMEAEAEMGERSFSSSSNNTPSEFGRRKVLNPGNHHHHSHINHHSHLNHPHHHHNRSSRGSSSPSTNHGSSKGSYYLNNGNNNGGNVGGGGSNGGSSVVGGGANLNHHRNSTGNSSTSNIVVVGQKRNVKETIEIEDDEYVVGNSSKGEVNSKKKKN